PMPMTESPRASPCPVCWSFAMTSMRSAPWPRRLCSSSIAQPRKNCATASGIYRSDLTYSFDARLAVLQASPDSSIARGSSACELTVFLSLVSSQMARLIRGWHTVSATVVGTLGKTSIDIALPVDSDQRWQLNGVVRSQVDHRTDLDLNFSPATSLI